jgi:hypothetical protein
MGNRLGANSKWKRKAKSRIVAIRQRAGGWRVMGLQRGESVCVCEATQFREVRKERSFRSPAADRGWRVRTGLQFAVRRESVGAWV